MLWLKALMSMTPSAVAWLMPSTKPSSPLFDPHAPALLPAPPAPVVIVPIPPPTPLDIRVRAYEVYLGRGDAPGDALSDWLQAERELWAEHLGTEAARLVG